MVEVLFAVMLFGAAYSYALYPAALALLAAMRPRRRAVPAAEALPPVSLIITAYNEAARIRDKLENSLALDYPALRILVASDCSTDATDAIVEEFSSRGVGLIRPAERRGKEHAQRQAIARATGDVLVFSDTGTRIEPDALRRMIGYFADPRVGAVSSEDRFTRDDGALVGEGAYVRYEMALRRLESAVGGLVGLSGSFFAARRQVCESWDVCAPSDFNTALNCARLGLKAVTAPDVHGYYKDLADPALEYERKVRTVLRGMTGLARHWNVMLPWRFGLFGWQVFSHKVMRWLVPIFLVGLFAASASLQQHWLYRSALMAQAAFYLLALLTYWLPPLRTSALPRLVYFFCQVNIAIAHAAWSFLSGRRMTTWQPSAR